MRLICTAIVVTMVTYFGYCLGKTVGEQDLWRHIDVRIWGVFDGSTPLSPLMAFGGECRYLLVLDSRGPEGKGELALCAVDDRTEKYGDLRNFAGVLTFHPKDEAP
jgi:hypothetical protein